MNEEIKDIRNNEEDEISLKELVQKVKAYWHYLLGKWWIILLFGLLGGAIGLAKSLMTKPTYTAHLSFAVIEKSSGSSGLAALASSFGVSGMGGGDNVFSGDNLLEIIQSRHAIEQTLLTPVNFNGKKENLVEAYIQFSELRKKWLEGQNQALRTLNYPIGQKRETFSRTQDSVLYAIYNSIVKPQALSVARKDKKLSVVNADFTSKDEIFSKLFLETLMAETYQFYRDTKTSQSRANIATMQASADSIKQLYESSLYKGASYSQVNINPALQLAAVPGIKQQNNAQLYGTVYAEVLKNLETLKLDLARETPLVQIIDMPRFPLKMERLGKAKGIVEGGLIGGALIVVYLLGCMYFKNAWKEN